MFFGVMVDYEMLDGEDYMVMIVGIDEVDFDCGCVSWILLVVCVLIKVKIGDIVMLMMLVGF